MQITNPQLKAPSQMKCLFLKAGEDPLPPTFGDRFELVADAAKGQAAWNGGMAALGLVTGLARYGGPEAAGAAALLAAAGGGFFGAVFATHMFDDSDLGWKRVGWAAAGAACALAAHNGGLAGAVAATAVGGLYGGGKEVVEQLQGKTVYHYQTMDEILGKK